MHDVVKAVGNTHSNLSGFDDAEDFRVDPLLTTSVGLSRGVLSQQRLQLVRRELCEIRDLLSPSLREDD